MPGTSGAFSRVPHRQPGAVEHELALVQTQSGRQLPLTGPLTFRVWVGN